MVTEIKAAAMETIKGLRLGPLFTPPSLEGTVVRHGVIGGAGWGGVAVDRETGWAYVKASHNPELMAIAARSDKSDTVDAPYVLDGTRRSLAVRVPGAGGGRGATLPLVKPPYGTLTAIDLNTGDTKWTIPLGDTPEVRNHPALAGVKLLGLLVTDGGDNIDYDHADWCDAKLVLSSARPAAKLVVSEKVISKHDQISQFDARRIKADKSEEEVAASEHVAQQVQNHPREVRVSGEEYQCE